MTITTPKELMRVIAKNYEKCKWLYLNIMHNIPFMPIDGVTARLKGLLEDAEKRRDVAITNAIFAAPIFETGEHDHFIAENAFVEAFQKFETMMCLEEFVARGYLEWDKDIKDEDGFPAVKIIVPPNEWDTGEIGNRCPSR